MSRRPRVLSVFWSFFIVGASAYGGPAMMPAMRRRMVDKKGWLTNEEFGLGLGLCQSLPGGTLMQLAAYTGMRLAGLSGAVGAYSGFSLPAFILVTILAMLYGRGRDLPLAQAVFSGLKVVVLAVCLASCLDFIKRFAPAWRHRLFTAGAAGLFLAGVSVIPIIGGAALAGLCLLDPGPAPDMKDDGATRGYLGLALVLAGLGLAALAALYFTDRQLFQLGVSMIKVDMLSFGGFGVLPVMYQEVVQLRGWMSEHTFMDGMALAQVTPGPVLLASAFVGYWVRGLWGAVVASVGVFACAFVIVLGAYGFRDRILGSDKARRALAGVLATLGGMIVAVSVTLARAVPWGWPAAGLLAGSLAALALRAPIPLVVLAGAGVSLAIF